MGDLGPGPTIEEIARTVGSARWVERRLFELLGAAVPGVTDRSLKLFLAEAAPHHAWRADQLGERLPRAGHVRADVVTVAPDDGTAEVLAGLDGAEGPELLGTVYGEVVPRLLDGYRRLLDRCSPVADAAVMRTLRMVVEDLSADLAAAERLLHR